jgi:hypothetical protein
MAWTSPMTAVAGAAFTAAQFNTNVRDNLLETAPAKATASGRMIVTAGANEIGQRLWSAGSVLTSETTTSTSYTDLTTAGPAVGSFDHGPTLIVVVGCRVSNNTAGAECKMGHELSGTASVAADDARALRFESSAANDVLAASYFMLHTGLSAGTSVATAKYSVSAGTGTFQYRRVQFLPL